MKRSSGFRTVLFLATVILFTAVLNASELRVYQLGSSWMVPDDYMDVMANPARINYIGRAIFSGTFDNFCFKGNDAASPDYTTWDLSPKIAHMGAYGDIGEGLIYKASYMLTKTDKVETSHSLDNDLTVIFGKKFGDQLSIGMSANFITLYRDNQTPDINAKGGVKFGADLVTGAHDFGAVLGASHDFTGRDNANFAVKLLYAMKDAGGSEIRAANETIYQYQKMNPVIIGMASPFGDRAFGYNRVDNNTGVSYINTFNSIKYFLGAQNNWKVVSQTNTGSAQPFNTTTEDVTEGSENVFLQAGLEAKFITDWLTLRGYYIPLSYTHNYRHSLKTVNLVETERRNDDDNLSVLGAGNLTIGVGVEFNKDMSLDVLLNGPGLLSYYRGSSATIGVSDFWLESGYSLVVMEFTLRM